MATTARYSAGLRSLLPVAFVAAILGGGACCHANVPPVAHTLLALGLLALVPNRWMRRRLRLPVTVGRALGRAGQRLGSRLGRNGAAAGGFVARSMNSSGAAD